jgi:hypothetical protein
MAEQPPLTPSRRRVLGDYILYQTVNRQQSSIVLPNTATTVEIKPTYMNMLRGNSFTRKDHEDPFEHILDFYDTCNSMRFPMVSMEAVYLKAFPYSLIGAAKDLLKSQPNQSITSWNDLEMKFLLQFFPPSKFISARANTTNFK